MALDANKPIRRPQDVIAMGRLIVNDSTASDFECALEAFACMASSNMATLLLRNKDLWTQREIRLARNTVIVLAEERQQA